jgi:pimeloyl-ACP methyl ester carboxylesterase
MTDTRRPLILLHGALGSRDTLVDIGNLLEDTYQVHIPDLPSHGSCAEDSGHMSVDIFTDFIDKYIKTHGLGKPDVFGYSLGGYIGLAYALRHPGSLGRIVTLATKYYWSPEIAAREIRMLESDVIEAKVPEFANVLKQRHGDPQWKIVLGKTAQFMTQLGIRPVVTPEIVTRSELQVTIALGSEDNMVTPEESRDIAHALPNGRFRLLSGIPHPIEKIQPEVVAALIRDEFS